MLPGAAPWSGTNAGLVGARRRLQGPMTAAGSIGPCPVMKFPSIQVSRRVGPVSKARHRKRAAAIPV